MTREFEDYENEIEDLHNQLDIAEYDKERLREEVTNLEAKIKALEQEPFDIETYCKEHFCVMVDNDVWEKAEKALKQEPKTDTWSIKEVADTLVKHGLIVEQEPILDKIRAEINRQEKWLLQAGYTAYNVDIALDAIKSVVAESEGKE